MKKEMLRALTILLLIELLAGKCFAGQPINSIKKIQKVFVRQFTFIRSIGDHRYQQRALKCEVGGENILFALEEKNDDSLWCKATYSLSLKDSFVLTIAADFPALNIFPLGYPFKKAEKISYENYCPPPSKGVAYHISLGASSINAARKLSNLLKKLGCFY
jgi:hypothetical protein